MLTIDVGCGTRKLGTINVDINRNCKPDVICDIHHLPFLDRQFEIVYCFHVLEHEGVNPLRAIHELKRISNGIIQIQVPHWLSLNAKKDETHKNFQVMKRKFWLQFNPFLIPVDYTSIFPLLPFFRRPNNINVQLRT